MSISNDDKNELFVPYPSKHIKLDSLNNLNVCIWTGGTCNVMNFTSFFGEFRFYTKKFYDDNRIYSYTDLKKNSMKMLR